MATRDSLGETGKSDGRQNRWGRLVLISNPQILSRSTRSWNLFVLLTIRHERVISNVNAKSDSNDWSLRTVKGCYLSSCCERQLQKKSLFAKDEYSNSVVCWISSIFFERCKCLNQCSWCNRSRITARWFILIHLEIISDASISIVCNGECD